MVEKLTPDPEKGGRTFVPTRSYDLKMTIDNLDYTQDIIVVRFVSSLATSYQSVNIILELDPNDVILQHLYGETPIKLAITLLREEEYPGPRIDLDLMFLNGKFQINEKDKVSTKENQQKDRGYYALSTVVRDSYKIMNTLVNGVYLGTNIGSVIFDLASQQAGAKKIEVDTDGQNTKPIDQICIPPTTLYKAIKEYNSNASNPFDGFLDQRFGLFDGVPGIFCQYDKTLKIKNLTSKMQKDPAFIVYQIATDMEETEWDQILKEVADDKTFYTYTLVDTDYAGNAKFAKVGSDIKHIVKPKDTLSETITQDLKTVAGKYSIIYKNNNLDVDPAALRTRYFIQDTGDETNQTIFNSRMSRRMADLSTLTIEIERNLPVLSLIDVGECVKFKPKTVEYADLEGKYILWSTDIWFRRENNWQTTASIKLMRTNKRAGDVAKPKQDVSILPERRQEEREVKRTARAVNVGTDVVEVVTQTTEPTQVTQSANNIIRPYQGVPQNVLNEIQSNQEEIERLTDQIETTQGLIDTGIVSRGATAREIVRDQKEIRELTQRNAYLSTSRQL